jgi:hypothetical protein
MVASLEAASSCTLMLAPIVVVRMSAQPQVTLIRLIFGIMS